jgi:hypothetical protein
MSRPVNILKVERVRLKSGLNTYKLLIDSSIVQDYFQTALRIVEGRNVDWTGKKIDLMDDFKGLLR